MKRYTATVRVVHIETWSVEAENEAEARKKIEELEDDVDVDETGGEVVDWEISSIKEQRTD